MHVPYTFAFRTPLRPTGYRPDGLLLARSAVVSICLAHHSSTRLSSSFPYFSLFTCIITHVHDTATQPCSSPHGIGPKLAKTNESLLVSYIIFRTSHLPSFTYMDHTTKPSFHTVTDVFLLISCCAYGATHDGWTSSCSRVLRAIHSIRLATVLTGSPAWGTASRIIFAS